MMKKSLIVSITLILTISQPPGSGSAADSDKTCDLQVEKRKWLDMPVNEPFNNARIALERFRYDWSDKIPWQSFAPEPEKEENKAAAEDLKQSFYKRIISVKEEYEGLLEGVIRRRLKACDICHLLRIYNSYAKQITDAKFEAITFGNLKESELRDENIVAKIKEMDNLIRRWKEDTDTYERSRGTKDAPQLQRYVADQAARVRKVWEDLKTLRRKHSGDSPLIESFQGYKCSSSS